MTSLECNHELVLMFNTALMVTMNFSKKNVYNFLNLTRREQKLSFIKLIHHYAKFKSDFEQRYFMTFTILRSRRLEKIESGLCCYAKIRDFAYKFMNNSGNPQRFVEISYSSVGKVVESENRIDFVEK